MKTLSILVAGALALAFTHTVSGAPGDLDPAFDIGSRINAWVRAIAVQSDGKVVIGGDFTTVHGAVRNRLARLNADGPVDSGFEPDVSGETIVGLILAGDKVLIAGELGTINGVPRAGVARLNADGSLDASFADGLADMTNSAYRVIARQPDGKVLVGGFPRSIGSSVTDLHRLNQNGSLDPSFAPVLTGPNPWIGALAAQSDGKILVAGTFQAVNGVGATNFARLNPDGSFDGSFTNALAGRDEEPKCLAIQPDDKIIVAGYFLLGQVQLRVVRLNPDGSIDHSFAASEPDGTVYSLALQPDGKILLGNNVPPCCMRLNADGTKDTAFLNGLAGPNSSVIVLAAQPDGKIVIGGFFERVNDVECTPLARLNTDGSLDTSFPEGPPGPNFNLTGLVVQPDGKVVIAGSFYSINGVACSSVARLNPDATVDQSFSPPPVSTLNETRLTLQPDGKILVYSWYGLSRINPDGTGDDRFLAGTSVPLHGIVAAVGLQPDGKIVAAGRIPSVGSIARANLVRLNPDGSLDLSLACSVGNADSWLHALAIQPDGKVLVGGWFDTLNGKHRPSLARVNRDGSSDPSFLNGLDGPNAVVTAILVQRDGNIIIGGEFTAVNGTPVNRMARLHADGSLDDTFVAGLNGTVYCMRLQGDGKVLLGGGFSAVNGLTAHNIARLNLDGSLDPSFTVSTDYSVLALEQQRNGKIMIGGQFDVVNQTPNRFVARLMGDFSVPSILTQPQSMTVETGAPCRFSVRPAGYLPVGYQWYFTSQQTTAPLVGCTNASLEWPSASPVLAGAYTVVLTNDGGAVTSAPAMLSVIPSVQRRSVPGLNVRGQPGGTIRLDYVPLLADNPGWAVFGTVEMATASQWCFDTETPLAAARFYRAWQPTDPVNPPAIDLRLVPAITLSGSIGSSVRIDYINQIGPTDAWVTLATVTLTNTSQEYFDTSAVGQPARAYRLVTLP
ncbi:MAG TPA: hypothetical protein VJA21_02535 [Verrucomicrobiae bacterium]